MIQRLVRNAEDKLRWHPLVQRAWSRWQYQRAVSARAADPDDVARSIARLCSAARWSTNPILVTRIQHAIRERNGRLRVADVAWDKIVPGFHDGRLTRAAILKPYLGADEKGVVFVSFEVEWIKLLSCLDMSKFARRYSLVIAPSSSPHNLINYAFAAAYPDTIFSLISNPSDAAVLPKVARNLVPVPLYASHWVDPELFKPLPRDRRTIDLVMVANFAKVKRHHVLFQALRRMPRSLRVVLIGQDQDGRTAETIRAEAERYGVSDRVTTRANLSYADVIDALCRSRASIVLSRREGSCVVVAESLFANTPVGLLQGAEIGSRVFINDSTGRFLDERNLAAELMAFLERAFQYAPRRWAERHLSCQQSTRVLNDVLREHALARGQRWTRDLATLCWRPNPCLLNPAEQAWAEVERREIATRFGLWIGANASAESVCAVTKPCHEWVASKAGAY